MQKINSKTAITLLLLCLLLSLFLHYPLPSIQAEPAQPLTLHSQKPLVPIHMHGPPLQPIHMHCTMGIIPINPPPLGLAWHELYPQYCETWIHTNWEDNGNGILDTSDQIEMTNYYTGEIRWYHVDRVTMTMLVRAYSGDPLPDMYVEFKGAYDPYIQPVMTLWHEVYPSYSNVHRIEQWYDNGNGYLDVCDSIIFETWPATIWHVEEYATDLILNEKIMDPIGISWHELYPEYCTYYNLSGWEESQEDPYPGRLSPGDQIEMTEIISKNVTWYYVDRVTLTLKVSNQSNPEQIMYIEYKGPFETMYNVKTDPVDTRWHEVYPVYCTVFQVASGKTTAMVS